MKNMYKKIPFWKCALVSISLMLGGCSTISSMNPLAQQTTAAATQNNKSAEPAKNSSQEKAAEQALRVEAKPVTSNQGAAGKRPLAPTTGLAAKSANTNNKKNCDTLCPLPIHKHKAKPKA